MQVETELAYRRQNIVGFFVKHIERTGRVAYAGTPETMGFAIVDYETDAKSISSQIVF